MKNWQYILFGLFGGMIVTAVLFLVTAPPRGESVELLPAPTPAPIMVYVTGAVQQPGVYTLPRDSRVQDAIQAAGGFGPKANQSEINLAARLNDGSRVNVLEIGMASDLPSLKEPSSSKSGGITESTPGALVNINNASLEDLQTLPGIGATRAQDIIDYRNAHGEFKTIEELLNVSGIGDVIFERIKARIIVD